MVRERTLVLASASPSRARILDGAGIRYQQIPSSVDEDALTAQATGLSPADLALLLAQAKAEAVARESELPPGALVLGCDSVLELDGVAHGKPHTPQEATARWRQQRGRTADLVTGHWLMDPASGRAVGRPIRAAVNFAAATDEEIADYVASGEPLHVAGAFTLEGRAGPLIESVTGDPSNVLGLSLPGLRALLSELGVTMREVSRPPIPDHRQEQS